MVELDTSISIMNLIEGHSRDLLGLWHRVQPSSQMKHFRKYQLQLILDTF